MIASYYPLGTSVDTVIQAPRWGPIYWDRPGIYALWVGQGLYVGCSMDIAYRLRQHGWTGHKWDKAQALQLFSFHISKAQLMWWESYWIELLRPSLNKKPISLATRTERMK